MTEKIKESSLKGPSLLFSYVPPPKIFLFVAHIHRSKGVRCTRRVISVVAKGAVQNLLRHFDHSALRPFDKLREHRLRERGGWGGDKRSLAPTVRARRRRVALAMEAGAGTLNGG